MSVIATADDSVAIKKEAIDRAFDIIKGGGLVVVPTKVGYILAGSCGSALERKFNLKNRPLGKPAVVLTRYNLLDKYSKVPEKHRKFIDEIEKTHVLCGFIMQRREEAFSIVDAKGKEMSQLSNGTSCFVINHGAYTEYLVDRAESEGIFILASSANPSGTGNRGRFCNIGDRILEGVDFSIEHDEYVAQRYQPDSGEQGVMVSLLDDKPTLIRKGLNEKEIMDVLTSVYGTSGDGWIYKHGAYA